MAHCRWTAACLLYYAMAWASRPLHVTCFAVTSKFPMHVHALLRPASCTIVVRLIYHSLSQTTSGVDLASRTGQLRRTTHTNLFTSPTIWRTRTKSISTP